jgi:RimJ/RimL family protein N-acetyltransferase
VLARPYWGHGYATEAARAAIGYAFDQLDTAHVISLIRPENKPSIHLAERLGETYERTIDILGVRADVYSLHRP